MEGQELGKFFCRKGGTGTEWAKTELSATWLIDSMTARPRIVLYMLCI